MVFLLVDLDFLSEYDARGKLVLFKFNSYDVY